MSGWSVQKVRLSGPDVNAWGGVWAARAVASEEEVVERSGRRTGVREDGGGAEITFGSSLVEQTRLASVLFLKRMM